MQGSSVARRSMLLTAAAGAASLRPFAILKAAPLLPDYPFTLGVASGSPRPDRVVLWTRLAPKPLEGGGMPDAPVTVAWQLAADEGFNRIIRAGEAIAVPELAHSLHVEPAGLEPGRAYFYRFRVGMAVSPTGRTRTAPAPGSSPDRLRFAVASCQQYEQGYFAAYRDIADRDLDLVVHVGDYIYESSWGARPHVRRHLGGLPATLQDYRQRHAQYKTDANLQAAHAATPWLSIWDDHDVANDYADDISPATPDPVAFLALRAAAYQAYYEHMPLPASARPVGTSARLYDHYAFGGLADMMLLDDRQYRSHRVCIPPGARDGWANCADRFSEDRSLLGWQQEAWLDQALQDGRGRWTFVLQQTLMSECDLNIGKGDTYFMDAWDGYAASRGRLLDSISRHKPANPVVLGGDMHAFCAVDVRRDFRDSSAPILATEFVGTSITSEGPPAAAVNAVLARNPHFHFASGEKRGFLTMDVRTDRCEVGFEAVVDEKDPNSRVTRLASFACESGKAGVQR